MEEILSHDRYYDLWVLLRRSTHVMVKARQKELSRYGLSPQKAGVLYTIMALGDDATPSKISRWLLTEPHSVSELLSRMEKQGLVTKVENLDRNQPMLVELTEKGREAYWQSTKRDAIHKVVSYLSQEQRHHWDHLCEHC